jgi:CheY-like chemotaxis protein
MTHQSNHQKSIFFIEDDAAIVDVYTTAFSMAGIVAKVFTLGKAAIDAVESAQQGKQPVPNLILLDLMLPDIPGADIYDVIKKSPVTASIPIFVTSNYTMKDMPEMERIKADKVILKTDVTPTQLVALIKEQLGI